METSRRSFMRMGCQGVLGGIVLYALPSVLKGMVRMVEKPQRASAAGVGDRGWEQFRWGFVCDNTRCIGCGRCVVACKLENKVPWEPEYNRTWVERYVFTEDERVLVDSPNGGRDGFVTESEVRHLADLKIQKSFFVPKLCNQCDRPPCVTVCPVGATYMTEDGVILIDQDHCIGCRYCIQACPYGARFFIPERGIVDKCTWCYHRIHRGMRPACVEACPAGARIFGDLTDPNSSVSRIMADKRVYALKPDLGTEPKLYYIGFEKGVH